jgi:hypothetical protein
LDRLVPPYEDHLGAGFLLDDAKRLGDEIVFLDDRFAQAF